VTADAPAHPSRSTPTVAGGLGAALSLPAVALAAPFWGVSALTRWLAERLPLETTVADWTELVHYDPDFGCKTMPNLDTHGLGETAYQLSTDSEGWRYAMPLDDADVLVVGDSFAFSTGVDDADGYPQHTGHLRVKGLGTVAYSLVHEVLLIERLEARLRGRPVVLLPYLGNDLDRSLRPNYRRYRMPYVRQRRDGGWEVRTDHVSPEPFPFYEEPTELIPLARICTPGPESDRTFEAAAYLLARARDACERAGSSLTLMPVPHRSQIDPDRIPELVSHSPRPEQCDPRLPDRVLARQCAELGIDFVPLSEHVTAADYNQTDVHWRASGYRKFGQLLAEHFRSSTPHHAAAPSAPIAST
jgi:hypothetical protein